MLLGKLDIGMARGCETNRPFVFVVSQSSLVIIVVIVIAIANTGHAFVAAQLLSS